MNIISHRGNINGPITCRENAPSYIDAAIQLGYDVEVDVRHLDGNMWLGHDEPQYRIEFSWMSARRHKLWFHCKDALSAMHLLELGHFVFFCHSQDPYVLTSHGHLWVHDKSIPLNGRCIVPLLDDTKVPSFVNTPYGICTDFVVKYR